MNEENTKLQGKKITENVWLCPDGVYRWSYEYDMLKNPTIIFTVWKVLGISAGAVVLLDLVSGLIEGNFQSADDWWGLGKLFLIVAGIMLVLSIIAYLIVASMYGWKYQVLFEMTDDYVRHIQMPKQFKKSEAVGWLTALVGIAAKNPGTVGAGILAASHNTMTSELKNVKNVKIRKRRHTIHVNQALSKNQVYAEDADFDFVERFLKEHCNNAKIIC